MNPSLHKLLCLAVTAVAAAGCAGYQVGTRSLHYPDVRTVYVPVFESDSFRRNLGEQLTEAVVRQIELKTTYKVVNDPRADSVLTGRIMDVSKLPVTVRLTGDVRDVETKLHAQINWTDHRGNLLGQPYSVAVAALLADASQANHVVPEAGQSIATGYQQAIDRLAEQIVSQLEVPW